MSKGEVPLAASGHRRRWGRTPRTTISIGHLENLWAGFGHCARLGLIPNETFDIHFAKGDLHDPHNNARPSLQAFLKSARQWIERKGGQAAYIWTLENLGDGSGHGIHAHVLFHVPPALSRRFHELKPRWARKAGLNMAPAGVLNRTFLPTAKAAKGKMKYLSKDLDPAFWPLFHNPAGRAHLDDSGKPSDQPIYGKKCGVSRNIDAKARAAYSAQAGGLAGAA